MCLELLGRRVCLFLFVVVLDFPKLRNIFYTVRICVRLGYNVETNIISFKNSSIILCLDFKGSFRRQLDIINVKLDGLLLLSSKNYIILSINFRFSIK